MTTRLLRVEHACRRSFIRNAGLALLGHARLAMLFGSDAPSAAASLPTGRGLAQHDLLVGGEDPSFHVIRDGEIRRSWRLPEKRGGIKDAVMLSTGDVLVAFQFGALQVSPAGKIVWRYDAPEGFEVHTLGAIGCDRVWILQNGVPCRWMLFHKVSGTKEHEFVLPAKGNVHAQTRRARITPDGTLLVGHMDLRAVREYDFDGNLVWSAKVDKPWGVARTENGNTVVLEEDNQVAVELSRGGERLWEYDLKKPFGKRLGTQSVTPLPNGNFLFNVRFGQTQLLEVSRKHEIVWALNAPQVGSCACVQVLRGTLPAEAVRFGPIH